MLDRFPRLAVCLPHAGGALPYLIGRLNHGWKVRQECRALKKTPFELSQTLYLRHDQPRSEVAALSNRPRWRRPRDGGKRLLLRYGLQAAGRSDHATEKPDA
jgi:hypothetical protein